MDEWGWNSEKKVRMFLEDLKTGNKDPMIEIGPNPWPKCGPKIGPNKGPKCMIITILNYSSYQGCIDGLGPKIGPNKRPNKGPKIGPKMSENANGSPGLCGPNQSINQSINQQEQRTIQPSADATALGVSENSQVYNLYIEKRRSALDKPDWEPTASQAIQMRANIRKLLVTYSVDALLGMVDRYMADQSLASKKWPWTFFVADPIRWADGNPKAGNYVAQTLAKLQSEGL